MTHTSSDAAMQRIPLHRWLMHGAVRLGYGICYALETALVTPLLLQVGLPEKYYSLSWFLSPVLGLILGPVIGSASDRCTLRLGRRRPFILALGVGVLLGVTLFLNGSLIGLSIGDTPGSQPIGIVLTVMGTVLLDFCADASEAPIKSYLLDVVDTEKEKDMALNIHSFALGIGGAVGPILAGLDWTDTILGRAFKSQEQVLFLFTAIILIISVILHMLSIPERSLKPSHQTEATADGESRSQSSLKTNGENNFALKDNPVVIVLEMDSHDVECVMSNSDLTSAIPNTAIQIDPDLDLDSHILPKAHYFPTESQYEMEESSSPPPNLVQLPPPYDTPPPTGAMVELQPTMKDLMNGQTEDHFDTLEITALLEQGKAVSGVKEAVYIAGHSHPERGHDSAEQGNLPSNTSTSIPTHPHTTTFLPPHSGRMGSQVAHLRRPGPEVPRPIPSSLSRNNPHDSQQRAEKRGPSSEGPGPEGAAEGCTALRLLWISMLKMPSQLWRLCVCHLLMWFSIIAMAVFYTDFMGQVVYHGDPTAPTNSIELQNYNKGVQMGCWGLAIKAATIVIGSALLQMCLDTFGLSIKVIYILGTLVFSIGTAVMAIFPNVYVAMAMSSSLGLMNLINFYCPYALLGQYHEIKEYIEHSPGNTKRGLGIDSAILSCQASISQILVALALGAVVNAVGSVRVIPLVASGASFLALLAAAFLVIYPNRQARSQP